MFNALNWLTFKRALCSLAHRGPKPPRLNRGEHSSPGERREPRRSEPCLLPAGHGGNCTPLIDPLCSPARSGSDTGRGSCAITAPPAAGPARPHRPRPGPAAPPAASPGPAGKRLQAGARSAAAAPLPVPAPPRSRRACGGQGRQARPAGPHGPGRVRPGRGCRSARPPRARCHPPARLTRPGPLVRAGAAPLCPPVTAGSAGAAGTDRPPPPRHRPARRPPPPPCRGCPGSPGSGGLGTAAFGPASAAPPAPRAAAGPAPLTCGEVFLITLHLMARFPRSGPVPEGFLPLSRLPLLSGRRVFCPAGSLQCHPSPQVPLEGLASVTPGLSQSRRVCERTSGVTACSPSSTA